MSRPEGRVHMRVEDSQKDGKNRKKRAQMIARATAAIGIGFTSLFGPQMIGHTYAKIDGRGKMGEDVKYVDEILGSPQRIGDFEVFGPAVDPLTGLPFADQSWLDGIKEPEIVANENIQQEPLDLYNLDQVELSAEHQKLIAELEALTNIQFSFPKDPSQIQGPAGKWGITTNEAPSIDRLKLLLEAMERVPKNWLEVHNGNKNSVEIVYFVLGPYLGDGGYNAHLTDLDGKGLYAAVILHQSARPVDSPLIPLGNLVVNHGQLLQYVTGHEMFGHMLDRSGNLQFIWRFVDIAWDYIDGKFVIREKDKHESLDPHGKAFEALACWGAILLVNPENLIVLADEYPKNARLFLSETILYDTTQDGVIPPDWEVFNFSPRVRAKADELLQKVIQDRLLTPSPTNTPSPSPIPTNTPRITPTPLPTIELPHWAKEDPTIYLPLIMRGFASDHQVTPEPEGRFGRGSNLSDARRFNPNYENRRNNRRGR